MTSRTLRHPAGAGWWFVVLTLILMSSHIPLVGNLISVTVLVPPMAAVYMLWHGMARFDATLVLYFLGASIVAVLSYLVNRDNPVVSPTSFVYLIYLLTPFTMRITVPDVWRARAAKSFWSGFRMLMIMTSVLGLMQLLLMDAYFSFRDIFPEDFRVDGYNTTNAIVYGGSVFRANGFLFYEPSFFSQFLGLAILVEMRTRRNPLLLALFVAGMLASFSGTGLIMLAFGLLIIASRYLVVSKKEVFVALLPLLAIVWFGTYMYPEFFLSRLEEFVQENSSAYIRFVSPFVYVFVAYTSSFVSMLFGVGPGVAGSLRAADVMADFPGVGKILFEYGLLGVTTVTSLYFTYCSRARMVMWIRWPILLIQFLLNNGVFTPVTLSFFVLVALFGSSACLPETTSTSLPRRPAPVKA